MILSPCENPSSSVSGEMLLIVDGMVKTYGVRRACEAISFTLRAGEVLGIVGESGSGKSTVINCLSGQQRPSAGEVYYHSRDGVVAFERYGKRRKKVSVYPTES